MLVDLQRCRLGAPPESGSENIGVFHVLNLHGNSQSSRRVRGWRTSLRRRCVAQRQMVSAPLLKGGSGAVRPAQRAEAGSDS